MTPSARRTFDIAKAEALRERADGMSYAKLAQAMGLKSRQGVGHWFRGRGEPNVQQMKAMAEALGCHWLELVTDDAEILNEERERSLVAKSRKLDDEDQAKLDAYADLLLAAKDHK